MSRVLEINLYTPDNSDNEDDIDLSAIDLFDSQSNTDVCYHSSRLLTDDYFGQPVIENVVIDLETEMAINELNEWDDNELMNNTTYNFRSDSIMKYLKYGMRSLVAHNETSAEASHALSASQETLLRFVSEHKGERDIDVCELVIDDDDLRKWLSSSSSGENSNLD